MKSRAPWAVRAAFLTNGLIVGALYSRIPDIKSALGLSNSQVGTFLLASAVGVLLMITQVGKWCAVKGSRPIVIISSYISAVTILPLAIAENFLTLCLAFLIWGAFLTMQDVAMNAHASTVEHVEQKRYMSGFHGVFSIGALLGGLIGGLASQFEISILRQNLGISVYFIILATLVKNWWLPAETDIHEFHKEEKKQRPTILIFIGLLGLASTINEGAAGDWGGILARETFNAEPFLATLPYIFYNVAMVIGRFNGDRLASKFGPLRILFAGGIITGVGLSSGLLIGGIYPQIIAWFTIGVGMALVIPMVFSLAGEIARERFAGRIAPSQAVAMASGISYAGFMVGPPIMGFIAEVITLRWAMLVPAFLAILLAFGSRRIKH
ncbi:MAG: MFS transporter [Candidatus Nanopelagicaceae bacterium]